MPTETECKIPVADFGPIESRLQAFGAEINGEFFQDDRFFDSPEQRLLAADQGLRLRSVAREDQAGLAEHILTYKGARQKGALKQREEIEAGVSDPQAMVDVLDRLGFTLMLHLQKRRKRYKLGGCWVELDTIPLLGRFVEVEGPDGEAIRQVVEGLGLDLSRSLTDSYAALLMEQARGRGMQGRPTEFLL